MSVGSKLSVNGRLFVLPVGTERKVVSVCIALYQGPAPPGRGLGMKLVCPVRMVARVYALLMVANVKFIPTPIVIQHSVLHLFHTAFHVEPIPIPHSVFHAHAHSHHWYYQTRTRDPLPHSHGLSTHER